MEERNCYVYEDYRIDNWTCCYVGMGSKNEERGYNRFEVAERNDHHDNIMNSCGIARVIIRDNLTREEANALEEARIYYYVFALGYTIDIKGYIKGKKNDSHLTNQTWGGDGTKGRKLSEKTKKKIREVWNNKTEEELEEWKKKISKTRKGKYTGEKNGFYGKHHSEETRKKQSEARKGKNPFANKTEEEMKEIAKKMSEAWNNKSEEEMKEIAKKMSEARKGEKNHMYGKHHTKETKEKKSVAMKEYYATLTEEEKKEKYGHKGENNPMYGKGYKISGEKNPMYGRTGEKAPNRRKVRCVETGEIFNTVKEAREWCGIKGKSSIAEQIQGKRKSAGKHPVTNIPLHWEYVD